MAIGIFQSINHDQYFNKVVLNQYLNSAFGKYSSNLVGSLIVEDKEAFEYILNKIKEEKNINALYSKDKKQIDGYLPYQLTDGIDEYGYLFLEIPIHLKSNIINQYVYFFVIQFIISIFIAIIIYYLLSKSISNPLSFFTKNIHKGVKNPNFNIIEMENLYQELYSIVEREKKQTKDVALSKISRQVAHDIRSPLSALDTLVKDMKDIPETKRILIRNSVNRIHDIANDLLDKNRDIENNKTIDILSGERQSYLLSALIESIVSEKRISYRNMPHISIESDLGHKAYGLFSCVNLNEFKRVLSNLINNSVEALGSNSGHILISLDSLNSKSLKISIIDNAHGIPANIIQTVFQEGVSIGKENGSGLGLYYAKKTIETWGGQLSIKSQQGLGTQIDLILEKATPPVTFVSSLNFSTNDRIVILDDDQAIHNIWDDRFHSLGLNKNNIFHFTDPIKFLEWSKIYSAHIYLIDFEYTTSHYNGVKVIKELKNRSNTYLVTSRYEESQIISDCESLNIGLIPKGLAGFVPIKLSTDTPPTNILLDDDLLVRKTWEMVAKNKKVDLNTYASKEELLQKLDEFNKLSTFYIDSNLGKNIKGEDVAIELYQKGFTNLIMTSGYERDHFQNLTFIKDIIGKEPPFH